MYPTQHNGPHGRPPPPLPPALAMPGRYPQSTNLFSGPAMPAPSPRLERDAEGFLIMEEPASLSTKFDGREWSLEVPQQPIRARMCGFGDKDRRPITPPPCVRLIVRDPTTGKEINAEDVDISFFVITVDLWDEEAQKEVNLVKHAANSPSISTASAVAYPHTSTSNSPAQGVYQYPPGNYMSSATAQHPTSAGTYYTTHGQQGYAGSQPNYGQYGHPPYGFSHTSFGASNTQPNGQYMHASQPFPSPHPAYLLSHQQQALSAPHQPTGMFTRNLIGALSASAFRLSDQHENHGIWFILQDLSIRTDGIFRLKFNFVDVGLSNGPNNNPSNPTSPLGSASANSSAAAPAAAPSAPPGASLNTAAAPVLASVFTRPFQVFSAKKFPGVIESTELSRTFALQGIKIPIRKDGDAAGGKRRRNNNEEDDDDGEDE